MHETCADTSVSWDNYAKEATITLAERNALVEQMLPIAKRVVGMMLRSGERSYIDRDELEGQANMAVLNAVRWFNPSGGIAIEERVFREVKSALAKLISREQRHWADRIRIEDVLYPMDAD